MTEPLTSNLVAFPVDDSDGVQRDAYWAKDADAIIERLTAELAATDAALERSRGYLMSIQAERDRLHAQFVEMRERWQRRDAYADRLAAALERISQDEFNPNYTNAADWGDDYWRVVNIAREALAGVQNHSETSPVGGQSHTEVNRQPDETTVEHVNECRHSEAKYRAISRGLDAIQCAKCGATLRVDGRPDETTERHCRECGMLISHAPDCSLRG